MDWDRISGNWTHWKGRVRERWGKLTDDELSVVAGRRDQLIGCIRKAYGLSRDDAERQLRNWERTVGVEEFDVEDIVLDDDDAEPSTNGHTK